MLVPKLCMGEHWCEAELRAGVQSRGVVLSREAELPDLRSQAELGNEGAAYLGVVLRW